jgi:hypothetical protein
MDQIVVNLQNFFIKFLKFMSYTTKPSLKWLFYGPRDLYTIIRSWKKWISQQRLILALHRWARFELSWNGCTNPQPHRRKQAIPVSALLSCDFNHP